MFCELKSRLSRVEKHQGARIKTAYVRDDEWLEETPAGEWRVIPAEKLGEYAVFLNFYDLGML